MPSGSDKRQRNVQCHVRFTEKEFAEVAAKAENAGWSPAAFLRATALGSPGPRTQQRHPADRDELRRILGQYGRIGNNINQIARRLNASGWVDFRMLREALSDLLELRNHILKALGVPTGEGTPRDHQGQQPRRT